MRRIEFDPRKRTPEQIEAWKSLVRKRRWEKIRTRPRDPEEERLLVRMAVAGWRRLLAEGKIERVGPRHYRFRVRRANG